MALCRRAGAGLTVARLRPITPAGAERRLAKGARELAKVDAQLAALLKEDGPLKPKLRPEGFSTFIRAILAQQVSVKAAETMFKRLENHCGGALTPATLTTLGYDGCRGVGLTGRKSEYVLGLAEAVQTGALDFDEIARMPDEAAIEALVSLRGIGRWTAEVYLLLTLGRPDVWPAADLALIIAVGRLDGLAARPTISEAAEIAERWQPYRGSAALLLWRRYSKAPA